ncbi:MAG: hypothetical protein JWP20_1979 [Roseomonas sp.]|nr:hypothetical protein [Roseomonas sp.]
MRMDHALQLAARLAPRPDDILSAAERLAQDSPGVPGGEAPVPDREGPSRGASRTGRDNHVTLRACQGLLSRTLHLLGG